MVSGQIPHAEKAGACVSKSGFDQPLRPPFGAASGTVTEESPQGEIGTVE